MNIDAKWVIAFMLTMLTGATSVIGYFGNKYLETLEKNDARVEQKVDGNFRILSDLSSRIGDLEP